jgi:hypothetical protein
MWVVISIIWDVVATLVCILLPIHESRVGIMTVMKGLFFNDDLHYRLDYVDYKLEVMMSHIGIAFQKPMGVDTSLHGDPSYRTKLISQAPQVKPTGKDMNGKSTSCAQRRTPCPAGVSVPDSKGPNCDDTILGRHSVRSPVVVITVANT